MAERAQNANRRGCFTELVAEPDHVDVHGSKKGRSHLALDNTALG